MFPILSIEIENCRLQKSWDSSLIFENDKENLEEQVIIFGIK